MKNPFGPLITAMVTPFDEQGYLQLETAVELAQKIGENGSDGIVLAGTTGESPTLSKEEKLELIHKVAGNTSGVHIIAGTGSNNTAESIKLTREAEKAGADGIMLVAPYYNKPPQEGLYQHFKEIAGATSLPVMIYNIPGRTGVNVSPETVISLSQVDNIVAVKDATKDLEQTAEICRRTGDDFALYSGDDSVTMPVLNVGGYGVVSVAGNLAGNKIKEIIDMYHRGNNKEAVARFHEMVPLFKAMFWSTNPIPVKEALRLAGYRVGAPRLPLTEMPEESREQLYRLLQGYNLID